MGATRVAALALFLCAVVRGQSCGSIAFSDTSAGIAVKADFRFEADFTIECWAKSSDLSNDPELFYVTASGVIDISSTGGSIFGVSIDDTWHHYAYSRFGSVTALFIDGALVTSALVTSTIGSPSSILYIGSAGGAYTWRGAIADFRVVKGTALYT